MSAVHVFWKHCGKRRNCSLRAISPFPSVFSTRLENFLPFSSSLKVSSANSFSLEESKICRFGVKGLMHLYIISIKVSLSSSRMLIRVEIFAFDISFAYRRISINSLPNDKHLDLSKLNAFADDNSNVAEMANFVFDRVENIVDKVENARVEHFLLFPLCFQKPSLFGRSLKKLGFCGKSLTRNSAGFYPCFVMKEWYYLLQCFNFFLNNTF